MKLKPLLLLPAAACAIALAGCSSDDDKSDAAGGSSGAGASSEKCPTEKPDSADPKWTLDGTTGSVSVTPATGSTAPLIEVTTPFSVDETVVEVIEEGSGPVIDATDTVVLCYEGVNGTTGETFDSSYAVRDTPDDPMAGLTEEDEEEDKDDGYADSASFSPSQVIPGFSQALVGQKPGARIAVAIPPKDGYGEATDGDEAAQSPLAGSTLVFEIHILNVLAG